MKIMLDHVVIDANGLSLMPIGLITWDIMLMIICHMMCKWFGLIDVIG
jgi:hypothetical protein